MSVCNKKEAKRLFKELPLYNPLIEKSYIKRLNNIRYATRASIL